jgi:hypothetical protein
MTLRAETSCPTAADHAKPAPSGAELDALSGAAPQSPRIDRPDDEEPLPRFVNWDDEDEDEETDEELEDEDFEFDEEEDDDDDYEEEDDEFFVEDDDEGDEELEFNEEESPG